MRGGQKAGQRFDLYRRLSSQLLDGDGFHKRAIHQGLIPGLYQFGLIGSYLQQIRVDTLRNLATFVVS